MKEATLRVFRGDSSGGQTVDYRVPVAPGMVVLDALHYIQGHLAPDLAVRWNCKAGKCGSCSAEVNGRPRLTCKTRTDDLPQDQPITVLPMKAFPCIKDLQVHRMLSLPKRLSRTSRARQEGTVRRAALLRSSRRPGNASARRTQPCGLAQGSAWPGLLQYHEVLHGGLSRRDSHHRQRHHPAQRAGGGRVLRSLDYAISEDSWPVAQPSGCAWPAR